METMKVLKMEFRKTAVLLFSVLFLFAAGCAQKGGNISVDTAKAADKLIAGIKFSDQMSAVDGKTAQRLFSLEDGDTAELKVYESTGATAEEVAVFQAKDSAAVGRIKDAAQTRIEDQRSAFEDYQPKEMEKLKAPVLKVVGNYVFLCVSDDNAKAEKLIGEITGQ